MSDSVYENFGFEVSIGFLGKITQAVFGFIGTLTFTRILGPSDFGGVFFLITVIALLRQFSGYESASKQRFAGGEFDRREIVGAVAIFNVLTILIIGAILFGLSGWLRMKTGLERPALLGVLLLAGLLFFSTHQTLLTASGTLGSQIWIDTVRSILTTPLQIGMILLGAGAAGVVYGLLGATFLVIPITLWSLHVLPRLPSRETVLSIWEYTKYSIPSSFVGKAYEEYDILLIGTLLTQASVGHYLAALKLTLPAMFVAQIAGSGLMSQVSDRHGQNMSFGPEVRNVLAYSSIFAIPLLFGAVVVGEQVVVTAYEPPFREAAPLLIGLAAYRLIRTQNDPYRKTLLGANLPQTVFRIDLIVLLINLFIGFGLALQYGALGVVIATVLSELLRYPLYVRSSPRTTGSYVPPRPFFEQFGSGIVMIIVLILLSNLIPLSTFPGVAMSVGVGGIVYFTTLVKVSRHFRHTVRSALGPVV